MGNIFNRLGFSEFKNESDTANECDNESLENGERSESLYSVSLNETTSIENNRGSREHSPIFNGDQSPLLNINNRTPTPIPISIPTLSKIMKESIIENKHVEKYPNYLKTQPKKFTIYTPKETSPLIEEHTKYVFTTATSNSLLTTIPEINIINENTTNTENVNVNITSN
jgi:hypothetical protein